MKEDGIYVIVVGDFILFDFLYLCGSMVFVEVFFFVVR